MKKLGIEKILERDWQSLEDYVVRMVKEKQTDSIEFQSLLRILGRQKLEQVWRDWVRKNNASKAEESSE